MVAFSEARITQPVSVLGHQLTIESASSSHSFFKMLWTCWTCWFDSIWFVNRAPASVCDVPALTCGALPLGAPSTNFRFFDSGSSEVAVGDG